MTSQNKVPNIWSPPAAIMLETEPAWMLGPGRVGRGRWVAPDQRMIFFGRSQRSSACWTPGQSEHKACSVSHVSCPAETSYALYTPQSGGLNDERLLLVPAEAAAVCRRCSSLHTPPHSCGGQQNKLSAHRSSWCVGVTRCRLRSRSPSSSVSVILTAAPGTPACSGCCCR